MSIGVPWLPAPGSLKAILAQQKWVPWMALSAAHKNILKKYSRHVDLATCRSSYCQSVMPTVYADRQHADLNHDRRADNAFHDLD